MIGKSVQKWVLKRILVPDSVLVEHEDLFGHGALEDQVGVEHVDVPEEGREAL